MAVAGGDGSDDTRRSKSGARRTTAMVALVGEGRAGGSMAEVVDPSILLADYQAKVERLIPASERGPGLTFLMLLLPVAN